MKKLFTMSNQSLLSSILLPVLALLLILTGFTACVEQEELVTPAPKIKKMDIIGYLLNPEDSVEIKIGGKNIPYGKSKYHGGGRFIGVQGVLLTEDMEVEIIKKGETVPLLKKKPEVEGFRQDIVFYHDGKRFLYPAPELVAIKVKGYMLQPEDSVSIRLNGLKYRSGEGGMNFGGFVSIDDIKVPAGVELELFLKGKSEPFLKKVVAEGEPEQTISFLHDGKEMVENIELTPPADNMNMALRFKFTSSFYKEPVDIVFKEFYFDLDKGEYTLGEPVATLKNVDITKNEFSQLVELPPYMHNLIEFDIFSNYVALIYKAGTEEYYYPHASYEPFTGARIAFATPDFDFPAGESKLIVINDKIIEREGGGKYILVGAMDITEAFK